MTDITLQKLLNFIARTCAVLFTLSGALALTFFNIERTTFSPETYKRAFEEQGLYTYAPAIITQVITQPNESAEGLPSILSLFSSSELKGIVNSLLSPDEFEQLTNNTLDSVFAFLNSESNVVVISLAPFKQRLAGEGSQAIYLQYLATQPDCTAEQILFMGLGFLTASDDIPLCNPPAEMMAIVLPLMEAELNSLTAGFPDTLTVVNADNPRAFVIRDRLDRIRSLMKITPLIPLFFLLTLTLLAVRNLRGWLQWWGLPIAGMGALGLFLGFVGAPIVRFILERVILQGNTQLPSILLGLIQNVTGSVIEQILEPVVIQGAIFSFIGIGMFIAARFLPRRESLTQSRQRSLM